MFLHNEGYYNENTVANLYNTIVIVKANINTTSCKFI